MDAFLRNELLPTIGVSLAPHQFLAIKVACGRLDISVQDLEGAEELTGVYSLLTKKSPKNAPSLMYRMLVRVGCRSASLRSNEHLVTDDTELDYEVDVILTTASMVDRMDNEKFDTFRNFAGKNFLSNYHEDNFSSRDNLLKHLFEKKEPVDVLVCIAGQCPEYRQEFDNLCKCHGVQVEIPVPMMSVASDDGSDDPLRNIKRFLCCVNGWPWLVGVPILFVLLSICAIGVFIHYFLNPVPADVATQPVYAPYNIEVTALIGCFSSLTKRITVSKVTNDFYVSLYKIQQDRLQVHPVLLPEKVIRPKFKLTGYFNEHINYYGPDYPIYTAEDGNVIFNIQVEAAPDNACPLRLFVFNGYSSYHDFILRQPPSGRKIESYYETPCLLGNQSFVKEVNLQGNSYYFFGIMYNYTTIEITASANTSQYSIEAYDENCTLSTDSIPCSFSASSFFGALRSDSDKQCLVSQTYFAENGNVTVAAESHVGGVYSGAVMMGVVFLLILAITVCSLIICYRCSRNN